ncbi:hypothetical protein I3760_14G072200 [Carya illinoinensis]|uniref:IMS import disulfide relay-system CHCH-CHCH-like Cx9C domain-containing protein n=1 Tax=Carya illinoinensis TaxID=32201 RepID=A0A8T1NFT0_CARIL|nr:uncharacterized protein LOC122293903 [Carya illinoinensis]KAG2670186.1 hypothetical protein I3760_14G072200 [Carya illinoinensis]KAG6629225.1 hypothetical protein CIPAW_14G069900 [Carya illinoinensis]
MAELTNDVCSFLPQRGVYPVTFLEMSEVSHCFKHIIIGRKAGSLHINPKKFGSLHKPCMKEMITFLNCLALSHNDNDKCLRQKELLSACTDSQTSNKRKSWGSINYHLQRLNRGRK